MSVAGELIKAGLDIAATKIKIIAGRYLQIVGDADSNSVTHLIKDSNDDSVLCTGITVPSDTTTGFAKGCLFIDTDVATGTTGLNCNKGTNTSCVFTAVTQA